MAPAHRLTFETRNAFVDYMGTGFTKSKGDITINYQLIVDRALLPTHEDVISYIKMSITA